MFVGVSPKIASYTICSVCKNLGKCYLNLPIKVKEQQEYRLISVETHSKQNGHDNTQGNSPPWVAPVLTRLFSNGRTTWRRRLNTHPRHSTPFALGTHLHADFNYLYLRIFLTPVLVHLGSYDKGHRLGG